MLSSLLIDGILLDYDLGIILLVGFVLTTLGALPLKSQQLIGVNTILFGLIFVLSPLDTLPSFYLFFGLTLLIIGPMVYVTATD